MAVLQWGLFLELQYYVKYKLQIVYVDWCNHI